jgi:hypothetical protein
MLTYVFPTIELSPHILTNGSDNSINDTVVGSKQAEAAKEAEVEVEPLSRLILQQAMSESSQVSLPRHRGKAGNWQSDGTAVRGETGDWQGVEQQ